MFPYAIGGSAFTRDTVCHACNHRVNRDVESPALPGFRVFQSLHGIEGRRGRVPGVAATATVEGVESRVTLGRDGRPTQAVVRVEYDGKGGKRYVVYAQTQEALEEKFRDIQANDPGLTWTAGDTNVEVKVVADTGFDPADVVIRRLATKIAFERFAALRGSILAKDTEFDDVRDFILSGTTPQPCVGVCADPRLLDGPLNIPMPCHAVCIIGHPADRVLGGFVLFFGLFLYWVVLSRRYFCLGPLDDLLIERPQSRETHRPALRSGLGSVRVPWDEIAAPSLRDERGTTRAALAYAGKKFRAAVDATHTPGDGGQTR